RYRFWRGPFAADATFGGADLWLCFTSTDGAGDYSWAVKPEGGSATTGTGSFSAAANTPAWVRVDVSPSAFTASTLHELKIGWTHASGHPLTLLAVALLEKRQVAEDLTLVA